jgi:hypothetical protein
MDFWQVNGVFDRRLLLGKSAGPRRNNEQFARGITMYGIERQVWAVMGPR